MYPKNRVKRVKRVTTTQWMSHNYALLTVLATFDSTMDTPNYIKGIKRPGDRRSGVNAGGLLNYFTTKILVLTAFSFEIIFSILENTSNFYSILILRFNYKRK